MQDINTTGITNTALVLGATGGIGGEVARQLRAAGWQVRAMKRGAKESVDAAGIEWLGGDALNEADVMRAAQGCSVIVHAVNPPGYRRWAEWVLPMIDNTIKAARAQGATVVLPGTVYNYGPDVFAQPIREDAPQNPTTRKGAIRVALEQRLADASASGEMRVIIVRAGDFFGPKAGNNWLAQGMVKPGQAVAAVQLPSAWGVGHQYAYLPDVAATMLALLQRRHELPAFARFHMAGYWDADGREFGRAIQRVVARRGGHLPKLKAFPWWLLRLASPFVATLRELMEMRYLWSTEVRMDNQLLMRTLGKEPHTALEVAIEATLVGLGCFPVERGPVARTVG
ncbi:NAD-dependent epimerase/dehydratase family protein [Hylemonella gracilis]|uniref:NAD-dependent epimerase/dehydratase family protein n=1 Tax=Hylemonella gracilis TaxID=80880 RepID=A0A4P6UI73_9BURK|nr:NAD-dependent epimerase/dehydratase family protein [Hylemonella gracilis]QBK03747.1 NAD-dependent epimerase/dehydratase family protein [Hylemonella gracilis]